MLSFSLLVLTVYLGVLIGNIISANTKEELKPGNIYFRLLKIISIGFISGIFLNQYFTTTTSIILATIIALFSTLIEKKNFSNFILYTIFSILITLTESKTIMGIIIFFFGISTSSADYDQKKSLLENIGTSIKQSFVFIILALLLFYFRTEIPF